jgi:hypothetical protein
LRSFATKVWRVARRLERGGREADWRARSGREWVSKVVLMAVGEEFERTSALRAAFLMW